MFDHSFTHILVRRYRVIVLVGLAFAVVSLGLSFLFPLEYRADSQLLIISKARYGVDPYTVAKSTERIGENLAQVIGTNDFFEKVLARNENLNTERFQNVSDRVRRKRWEKAVQGTVVFGTSILAVNAYHTDADQAKLYAQTVMNTLIETAPEYIGTDVTLKVVNQPIVTTWPVRPNIPANMAVGFVAGILGMSAFVLLKERKRILG